MSLTKFCQYSGSLPLPPPPRPCWPLSATFAWIKSKHPSWPPCLQHCPPTFPPHSLSHLSQTHGEPRHYAASNPSVAPHYPGSKSDSLRGFLGCSRPISLPGPCIFLQPHLWLSRVCPPGFGWTDCSSPVQPTLHSHLHPFVYMVPSASRFLPSECEFHGCGDLIWLVLHCPCSTVAASGT